MCNPVHMSSDILAGIFLDMALVGQRVAVCVIYLNSPLQGLSHFACPLGVREKARPFVLPCCR